MLYRIEVNVIAMPFEIDLVTQGVLPVASLLDATFAFGVATWRTRLTTRNTSGELRGCEEIANSIYFMH